MIKTLIIDANNLLKIGFHGVKDYYHNGNHIGGIWHFLNTTRRFIEEYNFDKVIRKNSGSKPKVEYCVKDF